MGCETIIEKNFLKSAETLLKSNALMKHSNKKKFVNAKNEYVEEIKCRLSQISTLFNKNSFLKGEKLEKYFNNITILSKKIREFEGKDAKFANGFLETISEVKNVLIEALKLKEIIFYKYKNIFMFSIITYDCNEKILEVMTYYKSLLNIYNCMLRDLKNVITIKKLGPLKDAFLKKNF